MKFLHITFHFEYAEEIEQILDRHEIENYVRYPMQEGRDRDGKKFGTKVFPGSTTVVQAQVPDDGLEGILRDLEAFREKKTAHHHLEALVLPIEQKL
ncbi:MAG: PG0541 family transporter-associated protein [Desulfurivibrionaceae bacterium]